AFLIYILYTGRLPLLVAAQFSGQLKIDLKIDRGGAKPDCSSIAVGFCLKALKIGYNTALMPIIPQHQP
ncbi:MAG: hypothetical protein LUC97_08435, partial [Clostridiales bacterium]|nr:hypothetical protein [Clostridiales bacterium]